MTADSEKEQDVGVTSLSFQKMLWVMEQAVTQLVQVVMLHHLQASGLGLWSFEIESPVYIVQECGYFRVWKKFIHVEKNGNFTLQKNNICSVTGNLPLKNCVMHIICHYLEGKYFCYYPKSTIKFWKVMEF